MAMKKLKNTRLGRLHLMILYALLPCFGFSQADSFYVAGVHPAAVLQSSTIGRQQRHLGQL